MSAPTSGVSGGWGSKIGAGLSCRREPASIYNSPKVSDFDLKQIVAVDEVAPDSGFNLRTNLRRFLD